MKIVVVGSMGTLGRALTTRWNDPRVEERIAANLGVERVESNDLVVPLNLPDFDVCSRLHAVETLGSLRPDVLINASGVNLIDWLETRPNTARTVHCHAVANLKEAARRTGATLVQFGCGEVFYREKIEDRDAPGFSEEDAPNPESVYAKTKLESERIASEAPKSLVLRFSSLYGETTEYSSGNLVGSLLNSIARARRVSVINDKLLEPIWSVDVLCALKTLIRRKARGLYHLSGDSRATPYEVAEFLLNSSGLRGREIVGISTKEYGVSAPQSAFTVLRSVKYGALEGVYKIPDWKTGVDDYLESRQTFATK